MLSRRELITGGAAVTQLRPAAAEAAQRCDDYSGELNSIRDAVRDLRYPATSALVNVVRERQRTFFKQNQRFPEFIEVGIRVWEALVDWHVVNHQELRISRSAEGRYMMEYMLTHVVLRGEIAENEVGLAFDR